MDTNHYFSILKQLHDICRNTPAPKLVGMDAYNEIINFLYLRHLSDNEEYIKDEFNLKTLYEKHCKNKHIEEDLKNLDFNQINKGGFKKKELNFKKLSDKLLPGLIDNNRNQNIAFVKIMGDNLNDLKLDIGRLSNLLHEENDTSVLDGGRKAQLLINKIYSKDFLPLENGKFNIRLFPYDAIGEGFEKFMQDAGSRGGNWGQFFTNPQIINWIYQRIDLKDSDKIIDPFAGSGAFTHQAKNIIINPDNIYGQEYDDKMFKFLKFNSKISNLNSKNMTKGDSYDYYKFIEKNIGKFDKVLTNPPFGESIDILLTGDSIKSKFWKVLKTGKKTIKDSMGLGVWVIYSLLKTGGTAGFVTERGFLNNGTDCNSWQKRLRKEIITNCNITEILLLPKGIFAHTNFDTAIVIFTKGSETKEISFHQGYFKKEDKGKSNKKMYVKYDILKISFKDIVNKDWSLKYDDYVVKEDNSYSGIEYKTLGEVCDFYNGYPFKSKNFKPKENNIPVIKIGNFNENGLIKIDNYIKKNKKFNDSLIIDQSFIIAITGSTCGKSYFNNNKKLKMYINQRILGIKSKINNYYTYYFYLISLKSLVLKLAEGQAQPNISKNKISKLKIPILPPEHQQRIVDFMDDFIGENYHLLDKLVSKFKKYDLFKLLIDEKYDEFKQLKDLYHEVTFFEKQYIKFSKFHKNLKIKACFKTVKSEIKTLGEVCEFKYGKRITKTTHGVKSNFEGVKYPVYGGGGITFYTNNFNCNENTLIISRFGVSPKCVRIVTNKFFLNDSGMLIQNYKINQNYLNYYLLNNQKKIFGYVHGGGQKNMQTNKLFQKLKIPIPSKQDQEKVVQMIEQINKEESDFNQMLQNMKQMIQTIYNSVETLVDEQQETDELIEDISSDEHQEVKEEPKTKKKKNKKTKKKGISNEV